jgi:hypothetical protein
MTIRMKEKEKKRGISVGVGPLGGFKGRAIGIGES